MILKKSYRKFAKKNEDYSHASKKAWLECEKAFQKSIEEYLIKNSSFCCKYCTKLDLSYVDCSCNGFDKFKLNTKLLEE